MIGTHRATLVCPTWWTREIFAPMCGSWLRDFTKRVAASSSPLGLMPLQSIPLAAPLVTPPLFRSTIMIIASGVFCPFVRNVCFFSVCCLGCGAVLCGSCPSYPPKLSSSAATESVASLNDVGVSLQPCDSRDCDQLYYHPCNAPLMIFPNGAVVSPPSAGRRFACSSTATGNDAARASEASLEYSSHQYTAKLPLVMLVYVNQYGDSDLYVRHKREIFLHKRKWERVRYCVNGELLPEVCETTRFELRVRREPDPVSDGVVYIDFGGPNRELFDSEADEDAEDLNEGSDLDAVEDGAGVPPPRAVYDFVGGPPPGAMFDFGVDDEQQGSDDDVVDPVAQPGNSATAAFGRMLESMDDNGQTRDPALLLLPREMRDLNIRYNAAAAAADLLLQPALRGSSGVGGESNGEANVEDADFSVGAEDGDDEAYLASLDSRLPGLRDMARAAGVHAPGRSPTGEHGQSGSGGYESGASDGGHSGGDGLTVPDETGSMQRVLEAGEAGVDGDEGAWTAVDVDDVLLACTTAVVECQEALVGVIRDDGQRLSYQVLMSFGWLQMQMRQLCTTLLAMRCIPNRSNLDYLIPMIQLLAQQFRVLPLSIQRFTAGREHGSDSTWSAGNAGLPSVLLSLVHPLQQVMRRINEFVPVFLMSTHEGSGDGPYPPGF